MRKFITAMALMVIALTCIGTPAYADTYLDAVASQIQASSHVWQDPNMTIISGAEVSQLEQQIVQSGKPIYVAIVDQSKLSITNSSDFPKLFRDALKRDGAYVVVGLKAFRAGGFNTSYSVASKVPDLATTAFNNAKARGATKPDFRAINELVTGITVLDFTKTNMPSTTMPMGPAPQSTQTPNLTWLWWLLGILGVGGSTTAGIIWWRKKKEDERQAEAERLAQEARDREAKAEAERLAAQPVYTPYPREEETPREERVSFVASSTQRRKKGSPKKAQYVAHDTNSSDHPYYWSGGTWNGRTYGPGYYADNFWLGYMMGSMADNDSPHHGSPYDGGWTHQSTPAPSYDTPSGSYDSGFGGGGDFSAPAAPAAPAYHAPEPYHTPSPPSWTSSSFGGSDFGSGGGFSSGGGGGGDF